MLQPTERVLVKTLWLIATRAVALMGEDEKLALEVLSQAIIAETAGNRPLFDAVLAVTNEVREEVLAVEAGNASSLRGMEG